MGAQTATTAGNFRTTGSAPNRTFIFSVNGAATATAGGVTSAEVKVYETSNLVDITCVACTQGSTATSTAIVLENAAGTANLNALGAGTGTTGAVNTSSYRFNPNPASVCF
jgi:1-aminocyclopropane-1-carboxylate deaminase/D-cysteine desulfhydrase-like pyridoxal-dependent ACC family enzyme